MTYSSAMPASNTSAPSFLDRWHITDRLDIEGQIYGEWYSETDSDWAARVGAGYALDSEGHHILRVAGARSYRTPLAALREVSVERLGGGFVVVPAPDLNNEEVWSLEGGYTAALNDRTTLRLDGYYQDYRDLIGFDRLPTTEFAAQNLGPASAYGWESELMMHGPWYKVSLWYAYNYITLEGDDPERNVRAYLPARHKAGATLRFFLPQDWTVNLNYKHSTFTDSDHGPWGAHVPGFDRLDLTLARPMHIGKAEGEIMLGVSDLFNDTEQLVSDEGSMFYQHETPGRTFFARLTLHF